MGEVGSHRHSRGGLYPVCRCGGARRVEVSVRFLVGWPPCHQPLYPRIKLQVVRIYTDGTVIASKNIHLKDASVSELLSVVEVDLRWKF